MLSFEVLYNLAKGQNTMLLYGNERSDILGMPALREEMEIYYCVGKTNIKITPVLG
jgi:hypothetical protein